MQYERHPYLSNRAKLNVIFPDTYRQKEYLSKNQYRFTRNSAICLQCELVERTRKAELDSTDLSCFFQTYRWFFETCSNFPRFFYFTLMD